MGLIAIFAGAANAPIASALMAMDLFGPEAGAFIGITCVMIYLFSGHSGIYHAQRVGHDKYLVSVENSVSVSNSWHWR